MTKLTREQERVVACTGRRVRVDAGAGAGKTSTLVSYALARPRSRGLYVAFSKAVQVTAARVFPPSCRTSTLHSLAFASHGAVFQRAGKLVPSVRHAAVVKLFGDRPSFRLLLRARFALRAVNDYLVSSASDVVLSDALSAEVAAAGLSSSDVHADACTLWSAMRDPLNTSVGATHDAYYKLFALSNPSHVFSRYDYVLVDESQDLSPVADSLLQQYARSLVYVGDSAQSIYAFRGASDCLASMRADTTLQLTLSFRFGPAIAAAANALLSHFRTAPIVLSGALPSDHVGQVQRDLPYAVLCRTNAGVFSAAARAVGAGRSVHFVGGIEGYGFSRLLAAYWLSRGQFGSVSDPFLRSFRSFQELLDYADLVDDGELKSVCRVIEQFGDDIPRLIESFRRNAVQTPAAASGPIESVFPADVFLSTAHKAKGLEFGQVVVADDFPVLADGCRALPASCVDPQEVNLLYVAMTRAALVLEPPPWLFPIIRPSRAASAVRVVPAAELHPAPV